MTIKEVGQAVGFIGVGVATWVGAQFATLPHDVTTLKAQRVEDKQQLEKMDKKLDAILLRLPRRRE